MGKHITTNKAYGNSLINVGEALKKLIVLDADTSTASGTFMFKDRFKDRFINIGIAEQNMVSIAAGLASMGYVPVIHSLAKFIITRALDQIINSVAYPKLNVNLVGIYSGLSIGKDGATHQCLEDIAIMNAIPNMTILCPGSNDEIGKLLEQSVSINAPVYIRLCEGLNMKIPEKGIPIIGKGVNISYGSKITVITTGIMTSIVYEALKDANLLSKVDLIHLHTLKPVDRNIVVESSRKTKRVLTFEDHNIHGGLGSIVSDVLSGEKDIVVKKYGINDMFGCSGTLDQLLKKFSLSKEDIVSIVKKELV